MDTMDFSLQQIIKQEKETYIEDFETSLVENAPSFYIDIIVQKQESNNEYDWSCNALRTSFEETCSICGLICKNRYILLQHNISHLSVTLEPLNITGAPLDEGNENHIKNSKYLLTKSFLKCQYCNKVLPYRKWHRHKTELHVNEYYECAECGKNFKCKPYLRKHIRKRHLKTSKSRNKMASETDENSEDVVCPICSAILKNRTCFFIHVRNVHSKETVTCEICGSKLKCFSYYVVHKRRVHYNDGKEHKCDMCHKKFRSPRYLSIHKKNSHNPNKTKKYKVKKVKKEEPDIKIEIEESC